MRAAAIVPFIALFAPGGAAGLAACLFAASLFAQDQSAQITGTVVDAATHQPVKHATVNLNYLSGQIQGTGNRSTSTDATGAFSFDTVAEGRYSLNASHQNYPPISRPPRHIVEIKSGTHAGSITIELTPGATISGHVVDEDGDPLQCFVQASSGFHFEQQRGASNANEDGEYRIHNLPPGKYVVSARCGPAFSPRPFSAGPNPPPSLGYPPQFYPAAIDAKSAQAIEVAPGAEKPGVDFKMRPAPVTQIRGRVITTADVHLDGPANLQLTTLTAWQEWTIGSHVDSEKGTFEFNQVFPGSYYLVAFSNGEPNNRLTAVERVDVKDRPIETVLTLTRGVDIAGSLTIEDNNSNNKIPVTQIQIQMQPDPPVPVGVDVAQVKEDGTFAIKSVAPTGWRLSVIGPAVFLKSAWLGNTDVTNTTFEVSAGTEALRLVVSTNMGTISGTAPAGETVYASPDVVRVYGSRITQADQTGRFSMSGVPPGKYRIGVMDPGTPVPEEGGQEITVKEGETVTVDVKQP